MSVEHARQRGETMATQNLNAGDPSQVASAKMLQAFIGTPPKRLLIFTGIAIPAWDSNSDLDRETVIVDLNAKSNAPNPPFAATVGLASIANTDSDLIFATDQVTVFTDSGLNLFLACDIAVQGDRSVLNRFSYQATVFLDSDEAIIAGTIRWDPHDMTHNAAMEQDLFQIQAFTITTSPGSPGGFGTTTTTIEKVGKTIGRPDWQGNLLAIAYEIREPPLGKGLWVSVDPKPGAFTINSTLTFNFVQVSGPSPIILNAAHLTEKPVDFLARPFFGPR